MGNDAKNSGKGKVESGDFQVMTNVPLRAYLAGQALAGCKANDGLNARIGQICAGNKSVHPDRIIANACVGAADALLEALNGA